MMNWLSDWLKQVILIILLASFVDLLLPSQAMQRYVRTVVSLFLLLTLLAPLFELFQRDWDQDQLLAEAGQLQLHNSGSRAALQPLAAVLAESEKLKEGNAQEAKRLTESRLAEEMKTGLESSTGARVAELQVHIETDQKGVPVIHSVRAVLSHREESAKPPDGETKAVGKVNVEKVRPVTVAIDPYEGKAVQAEPVIEQPDDAELRGLAVRFFEREWQLPKERLEIGFLPQQVKEAAVSNGR
ncbi:MAG: spoIIIAF [Paenibacillaceae bacterium]|jgi:stage III sporulation protein AF|nr:spoIIIAF [Paenibacillaceae bacterium]